MTEKEPTPGTVWIVPKETEMVVITWTVDGKTQKTAPIELERGKTYTITVDAAHGGGGGAGLPVPDPSAFPHTA